MTTRTRHEIKSDEGTITFDLIPREDYPRPVLLDDGGDKVVQVTYPGKVIGTEFYPGEVRVLSLTEARKLWRKEAA